MSDPRPIGIFDSGIGGLTVVKEIFRHLPLESVVYFGDTARVPYGSKSPKTVETFALEDITFLMTQNVKILVAACHTVSSVVLDSLIARLHLPVLGVVDPGVRAALKTTKNHKIGVIGTQGTVVSGTYEKKLSAKDPGVFVISQACPLFVPLVEEGWLNGDVTERVARIYLEPVRAQGIDTLILGCTHYPLIKPVIQETLGQEVTLIDSAEETARTVAARLRILGLENQGGEGVRHKVFVSDIPHRFRQIGERFLGRTLDSVTQVDIEAVHEEIARSCNHTS
jgi:glutamate racemase